MEATIVDSDSRPTIMITNDDGIDAPGIRALVRVLVSTKLYNVQVCAPDSYASSPFCPLAFFSFSNLQVLLFEAHDHNLCTSSCVLVGEILFVCLFVFGGNFCLVFSALDVPVCSFCTCLC